MAMQNFPIDFIRETLEKELLFQHLENNKYVGGVNQLSLFSFYEQLKNQDQVDRYVERFRDLTEQANRSNLIANGVILAPENPTITNLYASLIIPLTFTTTFRTTLENRELMVETLNNLFAKLKGRSVNVAELEDGSLFYLRKVGNAKEETEEGAILTYEDYMYLGEVSSIESETTYKSVSFEDWEDFSDYYFAKNNWFLLSKLSQLQSLSNAINFQYLSDSEDEFELELGGHNYIGKQLYISSTEIIVIDENNDTILEGLITDFITEYGDVNVGIKFNSLEYDESNSSNVDLLAQNIVYRVKKTSEITDKLESIFGEIYSIEVLYCLYNDHIITMRYDYENNEYRQALKETDKDIVLSPYEVYVNGIYKLSLSFDSVRVENPITLNGEETCVISFGGSATLCDKYTKLGNDLVQVSFKKLKVVKQGTDYTYSNNKYYLEPLELPSSNGIDSAINHLRSNKFVKNSHASGIQLSLQYTFVCNEYIPLLKQWFDYARYGINDLDQNKVSPNTIYEIEETWSANGEVTKITFLGKIVETIDIENNENDVLTMTIPIQLQGANN